MKKISSQLSVALVCCLLGFMLAYQFRMLAKQEDLSSGNPERNSEDLTVTIEQLTKQKDDLEKKVNELSDKVKKYENAAVNDTSISKELIDELNNSRILTGSTDVTGNGVSVLIAPNDNVFGSNVESQAINDRDLVIIVNELNSAGAEAISINDIRITSRSGIRNAGNSILINEVKISPYKNIEIKAIGDKTVLYSALTFPGNMPDVPGCKTTILKADNLKILKYNKVYKFEYAKPVK